MRTRVAYRAVAMGVMLYSLTGMVTAQAGTTMTASQAASFVCSSGALGSSNVLCVLKQPYFSNQNPNLHTKRICHLGGCYGLAPGETRDEFFRNFEKTHDCVFPKGPKASTTSAPVTAPTASTKSVRTKENSCKLAHNMVLSENYLNYYLPLFEGVIHHYYNDINCICSAGVGHEVFYPPKPCPGSLSTIANPPKCIPGPHGNGLQFPGKHVNNKQIYRWEKKDLSTAVTEAKLLLHGQSVTQHEFDSIVDIIYTGGLSRYYHIGEDIKLKNYKQAIAQNELRDKNNNIQLSRMKYQDSGLLEAEKCN